MFSLMLRAEPIEAYAKGRFKARRRDPTRPKEVVGEEGVTKVGQNMFVLRVFIHILANLT